MTAATGMRYRSRRCAVFDARVPLTGQGPSPALLFRVIPVNIGIGDLFLDNRRPGRSRFRCPFLARLLHLVRHGLHAPASLLGSPVLRLGRRRLHLDLFNVNGVRRRLIRKHDLALRVGRLVYLFGG